MSVSFSKDRMVFGAPNAGALQFESSSTARDLRRALVGLQYPKGRCARNFCLGSRDPCTTSRLVGALGFYAVVTVELIVFGRNRYQVPRSDAAGRGLQKVGVRRGVVLQTPRMHDPGLCKHDRVFHRGLPG